MLRNAVGVVLAQRPQLSPDVTVQLVAGDVLRDLRLDGARTSVATFVARGSTVPTTRCALRIRRTRRWPVLSISVLSTRLLPRAPPTGVEIATSGATACVVTSTPTRTVPIAPAISAAGAIIAPWATTFGPVLALTAIRGVAARATTTAICGSRRAIRRARTRPLPAVAVRASAGATLAVAATAIAVTIAVPGARLPTRIPTVIGGTITAGP